jgi:RND superfamily putative drug exporter
LSPDVYLLDVFFLPNNEQLFNFVKRIAKELGTMKTILKGRYWIALLWIVAAAVLAWFTPNLDTIINQRGNAMIGQGYPSQAAQEMIDRMSASSGNSAVLVFYDRDTLSADDLQVIQSALQNLKDNKETFGITGIVDSFTYPEAKDQLLSKDNTTMIAQFTYEKNGRDIQVITDQLTGSLQGLKVSHYITGGAFIANDFLKETNAGVDKSALITIGFILVVLILMFRSPLTPLISLLTVGIAYLTALGIVGQLIAHFGFPVTSLTRMFLILILFGIGTDYNILLFNRFREELQTQASIPDAVRATYKTAGKTVVYSATTIFIAFVALNFVKFSVYRSGVAVAIGILVLVIELLTFTPALFGILGPRLFWPVKAGAGHKQSKIWAGAAAFSVKRPLVAAAAIAVLLVPVFLAGSYRLTFDNLQDMSDAYPSVQGFNLVSAHFSKGTSMPTTIVLSSDTPLDNNASLTVLDGLTKKLEAIPGVQTVLSPTQPQGTEIADLYSDSQTKKVVSGMTSANSGLQEIADGLNTMKSKLTAPDLSKVDQLVAGTTQIQQGMGSLTAALNLVSSGMADGAAGADNIADGIAQVRAYLTTVQNMVDQMYTGYAGLETGYETISQNYQSLQTPLHTLAGLAAGLNQLVAGDPAYSGLQAQTAQLSQGLTALDTGFTELNSQYAATLSSFQSLNGGLKQVSSGLAQMNAGLSQLESGQRALAAGLKQGNAGQTTIVRNMQSMTNGLSQISGGQQQVAGGLSTLGTSLTTLKNGIGESSDGLQKISGGIDQSNQFLTGLEATKAFNLPQSVLQSADFQKALDAYMSKDRKTVKLTVTLAADPYSDAAIQTVAQMNELIPQTLAGTSLAQAQFAIGGETSATNDLHSIAVDDMKTTQIIVLAGIFLVLVLIIKSFWIPVYIIGSLLLSFYASISLTSLFTKVFLHSPEIAWNVPFFGFVMIVALGVDYSIFLMMRFREYRQTTPHEGIVRASANVGGVVLSAAVILAGTFATLAPSGINTLIELAVCVCLGVLILSVVLLPFVIPSLISIQDYLTKKYAYQQYPHDFIV